MLSGVGSGFASAMCCLTTALVAALALPVTSLLHGSSHAQGGTAYMLRALRQLGRPCEVLKADWAQAHRLASQQVLEEEEWQWHEGGQNGEGHSEARLLVISGPDAKSVWKRLHQVCITGVDTSILSQKSQRAEALRLSSNFEVRKLVGSGPSRNRVDVVFMGDGYTASERARFFGDIQHLVDDMFNGSTFRSYLPLFNVWAIHIPAVESGIGTHGRPRKTPFELFRMGTELRGIYPGNPQAARDACELADGCDFPALIANDDYYGGLGGEFVVGTRSRTSGTIVLRHEMGHNFAEVGEEYDDGYVYKGANSERELSNPKWAHWLTEPHAPLVKQRAAKRLGEYPWQDLAFGSQTFNFTSDGLFSRWELVFTVSGCPETDSLRVFLDGQELPWSPNKPHGAERSDGATFDRQFYIFRNMTAGLTPGSHSLVFESGFAPAPGHPIRQLCSVELLEYGSEQQFKLEHAYVGAYPTWDKWGRERYRPTNNQCLMRNMTSHDFCPVCRETMWKQFLSIMSLIDDVDVKISDPNATVQLLAVPLAHLRVKPLPGVMENYTVHWAKAGTRQGNLDGEFSFSLPVEKARGNWSVTVSFATSEVRSDPDGVLSSTMAFSI